MNAKAPHTTVAEMVNDKLASIGEKIGVTKFERIDADYVASYIHGAYRIGVFVGLNKDAAEAGKDIAMQITALNPVAVDAASVPSSVIARENDIILEVRKHDQMHTGKADSVRGN